MYVYSIKEKNQLLWKCCKNLKLEEWKHWHPSIEYLRIDSNHRHFCHLPHIDQSMKQEIIQRAANGNQSQSIEMSSTIWTLYATVYFFQSQTTSVEWCDCKNTEFKISNPLYWMRIAQQKRVRTAILLLSMLYLIIHSSSQYLNKYFSIFLHGECISKLWSDLKQFSKSMTEFKKNTETHRTPSRRDSLEPNVLNCFIFLRCETTRYFWIR